MKLKLIISVAFWVFFANPIFSQPAESIKNINDKLLHGETTISSVLSDTSFMAFHSLVAFREVIKQNAKSEQIILNSDNEPGTKINVKGIVLNKLGNALGNKLIYVYQTSSEGWYSDTAPHILKNEGDRKHARLFGYFKTNSQGEFKFKTIKPKGYPNSTLPAHIHIEISISDKQTYISELLFDDDPRLVGEIRTRAIAENFPIVKNTGTENEPEYSYLIKIDN